MQEPGTGQQPGTTQPLSNTQPAMNTPGNPGGYAPIPEPSGYIPAPMQTGGVLNNDSGSGQTAQLPTELQGFNWGAALMTWIWSIGMKFNLGILALPIGIVLGMIPIIGFLLSIGMMIYFGLNGNLWAWQNRRWDSTQQFRDTQRVWMYWGIGLIVFFFVVGLAFGMMGAMFAARTAATMPQTTFTVPPTP